MAVMFGVIGARSGQLNLVFLVFGALTAAAAAGLTFLVQVRQPSISPSALTFGTRADMVFQAGIRPVVEQLGSLAATPTPDRHLHGKINRGLIDTAAHLMEDDPVVASFYALEKDPDTAGAERLTKQAISNEYVETPDQYVDDRATGSFLLDIANGRNDRYVANIKDDPDEWRLSLAEGYVTALLVPVRAGEQPKGILIVQAAKNGSFTHPQDREKYRSIAYLIGASYAVADLTAYVSRLPGKGNYSSREFAGESESYPRE
ncbi:GAF domain-containing protein [Streptomyces cellulosae]|uniref:GAF domain-containing protein n=1 Tax=Streptomyces cellulosae TaxID=1968 RepID=A0ABW7Y280_STRCE